jgi:hypothetical protein
MMRALKVVILLPFAMVAAAVSDFFNDYLPVVRNNPGPEKQQLITEDERPGEA